jgi:hypothetical protein
MEQIINLHVEKLPEGYYLATSDDVPVSGVNYSGRSASITLAGR